jgi:hypothetical protein
MGQRALLQAVLESICEHVYFQPPSNVQMEYPAIVYQRGRSDYGFADNGPYRFTEQYDLTCITRNPDDISIYFDLVSLPLCRHERFYVVDNLNHNVFTIYF